MNRPRRWVLVGSLLALGLFAVHGCSNNDKNPMNPGGVVGPADVTINIVADMGPNAFSPDPDTISVNQTVAWKNNATLTHSSTQNGGTWSMDIAPGDSSAPIKFTLPGKFPYRCRFHASMTGTIVVKP